MEGYGRRPPPIPFRVCDFFLAVRSGKCRQTSDHRKRHMHKDVLRDTSNRVLIFLY